MGLYLRSRMPKANRLLLFFILAAFLLLPGHALAGPSAQDTSPRLYWIIGKLLDPQGQPIVEAHIQTMAAGSDQPLASTDSLEDGSWILTLPDIPAQQLEIDISHPHFSPYQLQFSPSEQDLLSQTGLYHTPDLTMNRRITVGFWAATIIFLAMLLLIAFERLHSTTAALAGFSAIFLITYGLGAFNPDFFIFSFERGLSYINWEVIFLVMGMMIIIAIIEGTGIFQWLAFQAYRLSSGRNWLLVLILMGITALASALLDNFTTMLLMTPISLQIGLAVGINPLALIIPEVLASNVGGISTLVGTPTNILIGAYAGIGFTDFLKNQTAGVLIALVAMGAFVLYFYRKELHKHGRGISPRLYQKLEENARLEDPGSLWKAGLVFLVVLVGFIIGERVHMVPAVPAMAGATILLVWLRPDVYKMIKAVDWTTLVFFMALFVVVGAIQEVGLISVLATAMSRLIGENLVLGVFVVVFGVGTISAFIANIPLAASMLPIIKYLTTTIPGAHSLVLYYALSMGAAMGGNALLISGEANLVTAGITAQTDSPITFKSFMKIGVPVTYITLLIGFLWLLIHF
jgi:Na+/H+ antiporter NhaD/arsenite permease-like protein